jgi:hypothetical protein
MPYSWPKDTDFATWELDVVDRACSVCGRTMYVCDHRHHHIFCLDGPTHLVCKLNHCPDPRCSGHHRTVSPEAEATITRPYWVLGWDVFCWIGHRRFARHWSVPQIRNELLDTYKIPLSSDAIEKYIGRYQTMLAARQQDPQRLRQEYQSVESLILSIDGLQPEKGHETLYVVRELTRKATGRSYFTWRFATSGLITMSYFGRAVDRCRRASYGLISFAVKRTPAGYTPSMHPTVG